MKQSTFSAVMANSIKNLLRGYTKGIRFLAVLTLLLTLGIGQAWADIAFSGGYIYFDNSIGINQKYIQLCARQGSWTGVSTMTNISNTKLYYVANPQGSGWGGILGWVVIGTSTAKTNSNFDNWTSFGWCSAWNTYGFNSGSTYLIEPTSTSKSQSVNTSYLSGGYSALNSQQTIKSAVNGADANSKATISITSYKMTGNGTATEQTATLGTGAKDSYVTAAHTATTTLTVGTVATGYQFDGWYAAKTGGTALSTSTTYTYYPTAATTVYARFKANQYTVKFNANGGRGSMSNQSHTYGVSKALTANAFTQTGYKFEGWNTKADGSGTSYADNASVINLSSTNGATVNLYAQWTINTYSVKWVVDGVELTGAQLDDVTTSVNHDDKITTAPKVVVEDYCGDIFVGWTDAEKGEYEHGSSNLYTTDFPQITNETTFYAVFADYKE